MGISDTASSDKSRRSRHWPLRVETLERMEPAELRKQVRLMWFRLAGVLLVLLVIGNFFLSAQDSGWRIVNALVLAIQTALIIFNVIGLVKLKAYVRRRMNGRNI